MIFVCLSLFVCFAPPAFGPALGWVAPCRDPTPAQAAAADVAPSAREARLTAWLGPGAHFAPRRPAAVGERGAGGGRRRPVERPAFRSNGNIARALFERRAKGRRRDLCPGGLPPLALALLPLHQHEFFITGLRFSGFLFAEAGTSSSVFCAAVIGASSCWAGRRRQRGACGCCCGCAAAAAGGGGRPGAASFWWCNESKTRVTRNNKAK